VNKRGSFSIDAPGSLKGLPSSLSFKTYKTLEKWSVGLEVRIMNHGQEYEAGKDGKPETKRSIRREICHTGFRLRRIH